MCLDGPRGPAAHAVGVGVAGRCRLLDVEVGEEVGVDVDEAGGHAGGPFGGCQSSVGLGSLHLLASGQPHLFDVERGLHAGAARCRRSARSSRRRTTVARLWAMRARRSVGVVAGRGARPDRRRLRRLRVPVRLAGVPRTPGAAARRRPGRCRVRRRVAAGVQGFLGGTGLGEDARLDGRCPRGSRAQRTTPGSSSPWSEGEHDDPGGDEDDHVPVGERRAGVEGLGHGQRGGQRHRAAEAGDRADHARPRWSIRRSRCSRAPVEQADQVRRR